VTLPSASRPGLLPTEPPRRPAVEDAAGEAVGSSARPPAGTVTLADLIADAGPLPADAALECVQRLAERLARTPACTCATLGPADVLIDDDGGVWLRPETGEPSAAGHACSVADGMNRLGRLLAFLATGEACHLDDALAVAASDLPVPVSTVAGRLVSRNGACYHSYAELARETAALRGVPSPTEEPLPVAAEEEPIEEPAAEPVAVIPRTADEPIASPAEPEPAQAESTSGILVIGALVGAALAAAAYFAWQAL
jgi:hypothetical protein